MARIVTKESYGYAILLIILCSIAAISVWETISFLNGKLAPADYNIAAATIWTFTLGFMLIVGAFGLWAINFSAESESKRRVSSLIAGMDYILDGLISIDSKGIITAANRSIAELLNTGDENIIKRNISEIFTCLSEEDIAVLSAKKTLAEIEKTFFCNKKIRTLRFRSQPSKGLTLILISDITSKQEKEQQLKQNAQLQLIGEIAKGVAYDFDSLLCAITTNTAIIKKRANDIAEIRDPIDSIARYAEKGTLLARKLNDLAQSSFPVNSSRRPEIYIKTAINNLESILSDHWEISCNIDELTPTSLTGSKLEQVIINLGIIATDMLGTTGTLYINAVPVPDNSPQTVKERCACVITISASVNKESSQETPLTQTTISEEKTGVILSVIRSLIMETGGSLETINIENNQYTFKICLAHSNITNTTSIISSLPNEITSRLAGMPVLLATNDKRNIKLRKILESHNAIVTTAPDIISLLAELDKNNNIRLLILDDQIAEHETETVLRTITKIISDIPILVLAETETPNITNISENITFINDNSPLEQIIVSIVKII